MSGKKVAKTIVIEGSEFQVPLHEKMNKTRFKELYGERFGDRLDGHFTTLTEASKKAKAEEKAEAEAKAKAEAEEDSKETK